MGDDDKALVPKGTVEIIEPTKKEISTRGQRGLAKPGTKGLKVITDEERLRDRMKRTGCYICGHSNWYPLSGSFCQLEQNGRVFHGVECDISVVCEHCNTQYDIKFERGALQF